MLLLLLSFLPQVCVDRPRAQERVQTRKGECYGCNANSADKEDNIDNNIENVHVIVDSI